MSLVYTSLLFLGLTQGLFYSPHPKAFNDHRKTDEEIRRVKAQKGSELADRFYEQWQKMHDSSNGYFSGDGVPYHSVETLMVEAPDYGHETTSEAFSYYIWMEAAYLGYSGDASYFNKAWQANEDYMIPSVSSQSDLSSYDPTNPATYATEHDTPCDYPSAFDAGFGVGDDPLNNELVGTYGATQMYATHWLLDVDNIYGFGQKESGSGNNVMINTFQRGSNESVWRTIPQSEWELFNYGETSPEQCGYLTLFDTDPVNGCQNSQQWKYTGAPDADARTIQATYWALYYSKQNGADVSASVTKAQKLGDFLRYSQYDKYFKKVGCTSPQCPAVSGTSDPLATNSTFYLINWYYAWGGSLGQYAWAWKIGASDLHQGYQNIMAAWTLSNVDEFMSPTANGVTQWSRTVDMNIEFWTWLQSKEGAIAGGCSNSWGGQYGNPASDGITGYFYGMGYTWEPVYHDPPSNNWFGMQAWSMERLAEYVYVTQDTGDAMTTLKNWVTWVMSMSDEIINGNTFQVPADITWSGQPNTWTGSRQTNSGLSATIDAYNVDVGVGSELAHALSFYAAATGDTASQQLARNILDALYLYADSMGITINETRDDYIGNEWGQGFNEPVYVPSGWVGAMPNGDPIVSGGCPNTNTNFTTIRSWYTNDPSWPYLQSCMSSNTAPVFEYHRMWAQAAFAITNWDYSWLFPNDPGQQS